MSAERPGQGCSVPADEWCVVHGYGDEEVDRRVKVAGALVHVGPGFDTSEGSADMEAMGVIVEAARLHAAANPMPCSARRCTNEAEHLHGPECAGCLCQRGER